MGEVWPRIDITIVESPMYLSNNNSNIKYYPEFDWIKNLFIPWILLTNQLV